MASRQRISCPTQYPIAVLHNQRGVALVIALVISMAITVLVLGTIYFVTESTVMSGAGKRYATAEEAADGAISVIMDSINAIWLEQDDAILAVAFSPDDVATLRAAVTQPAGADCEEIAMPLPTAVGDPGFTATLCVERLFQARQSEGARIEFAQQMHTASSKVGFFYRITAIVTGPGNAYAENSVLYRYVP